MIHYGDFFPEEIIRCAECGGEGVIEKWGEVSRWSIDPPCAMVVPCKACCGAGFFIAEAVGEPVTLEDLEDQDAEERRT